MSCPSFRCLAHARLFPMQPFKKFEGRFGFGPFFCLQSVFMLSQSRDVVHMTTLEEVPLLSGA